MESVRTLSGLRLWSARAVSFIFRKGLVSVYALFQNDCRRRPSTMSGSASLSVPKSLQYISAPP
jgi:hypothetical protein